MDIPKPYSVKSVTAGFNWPGMYSENYHIMYDGQPIMILFAPKIAKTVCDAMNIAYRVGYLDREKDGN